MTEQHQYQRIALGGTFDHFHVGHQHFLRFAGQRAPKLIIGVTQQHLTLDKLFAAQIEDIETRKKSVKDFCAQENIPAEIVELADPFGPTLEENEITAVAVTELTQAGGEKINFLRKEKGLATLPLLVCQMKRDRHDQIITSTRIRAGEIDRTGYNYSDLFSQDLVLTPPQREALQHPFGKIVTQPSVAQFTAVVGDIVLETFQKQQWPFQLGVFDGKTQRSQPTSLLKLSEVPLIHNSAGKITTELVSTLKEWLATLDWQRLPVGQLFRIEGEEDLAAVVLGLLLPLGAHIYYGQPRQGIVKMTVNEQLKTNLIAIL